MKITYLGTAAAEGMPAMFCSCENCERARKSGGRSIRTRSQSLINEDLLIDFPADTYMHVINYGLDLRKVKNVLITHLHEDHLYAHEFANIRPPFSKIDSDFQKLNVYSSTATAQVLKSSMTKDGIIDKYVNVIVLPAFETVSVGEYYITALKANHCEGIEPYIYLISDGEKTSLYAHDTGWFAPETLDYLKVKKPYLNHVSLDCTAVKDTTPYPDKHMNLISCVNAKNLLLEIGCADEKTVFCLNHFSHNGGYTYDELLPVAETIDFKVSYDSMVIEY